MKEEKTYTLPNGDVIKSGDTLSIIEPSEMFSKTQYRVRYEGGRWVIIYSGNFPATHPLKSHENELQLIKPKPND